MKVLAILSAVLFMANVAMAQVVFSPGISYSTTTEDSHPTLGNLEGGETRIDLRLGYVLPMGLYVGGMYSTNSLKLGSQSDNMTLMGPTVGYYSMMGFYTLLTYHIMGEQDNGRFTPGSSFSGGKGPQIDVGWVFPISAYFSIGPQLTYRSIEFDNYDPGTGEVDTNYKRDSIAPYLSLWFMF